MSLTDYQRGVCRILAAQRVARGDRYVAGGAALNELLQSPRVSRDVDIFHDTREAVLASWDLDRKELVRSGYEVRLLREFPTFVEAEVCKGRDGVVLQWVQDSAFRFFPLIEHPDFGLALHPFDLATNKTLALIGRVEIRDWVDIIHCHARLQEFGYLAWAASGKDPGLSPTFILDQASRSAHYSRSEYKALAFDGSVPDAGELVKIWRSMLQEAEEIIALLPEDRVGCCVLTQERKLFKGSPALLKEACERNALCYHDGAICGVWPEVRP